MGKPAKKSRVGLILGLVGGGLVLALVAVVAVVYMAFRGGPTGAVEAYFDALRAGDAQAALSAVTTQPGSTTLLTDEVLQRSNELAPISDVRVVSTGFGAAQVEVDVNGETEDLFYDVAWTGRGWKVSGGVLQLRLEQAGETPLMVNGVAVDPTQLWVFPGTYEFGTGSENLGWGPESTQTVLRSGAVSRLGPQITETGEQAARAAVEDSMAACAEQRTLAPDGCPFQQEAPTDVTIDESTITWELSEPTAGWTPQLRGTTASGPMQYEVRLSYTYTADGDTYSYDQGALLSAEVSVDLTADRLEVVYGS